MACTWVRARVEMRTEAAEEGHLAHPRPPGDLPGGGPAVAPLREELQGGLEEAALDGVPL